jgi:queuine tRNA-ribosyltransferase
MSVSAAENKLGQLPPEMIEFTLLKTTGALAPRLGRISLAGRKSILTPAFIGNTSRGIIPHVSQDNFRTSVALNGVYVPLEDCVYLLPGLHCNYLTRCSGREAPATNTTHLQV